MAGGHRQLSLPHALGIVAGTLLGAGALYVPERVENLAGPATPLSFLLASAGALALAVGYATFCSGPLGDDGAGAYLHLSRTWRSRAVGFLLTWPKPAAYAALLALLAQYLARIVPIGVPADVLSLGALTILLALHLVGPAVVGRVGLLLSGAFTLFVLVLGVAALSVVVPDNFVPLLPTPVLREQPVLSVGRGALVALFGFVGFEACVALADAVRSPRDTLPRALVGGVAGAGFLVTSMAFVTLGVIPWARMIFASVPFVDAAASGLALPASALVTPRLVLATLAALVALSWAPTRTLAGLGEVVPPLAHTNRFGAPDVASVAVFTLAGALVYVDAVSVGLFLTVPGLLVLYVAHGVTTAALPVVNPTLYEACEFRLSPRLLALCGPRSPSCPAPVTHHAVGRAGSALQ